MLYAPPSEWIAKTPLGDYGVSAFHTDYSFLQFGRVSIEIHVGFETAKIVYPFIATGIVLVIALAMIGLWSLIRHCLLFKKNGA
ncbi:hypothetical protein OpiT1DRAFT_00784 [Opitutaceae bacterium TAV1]|nr:hypothetical protein OpiT1DRAFT_00784 [Opitutaceae bacterium TAV1]